MFDLERWQEIFDAIRKNKLRTFLTGLSVASGIFILVILLGFGQGMQNGIAKEFEKDAAASVWVWPGVTTKEYKGMNPGRRIQLRNENYDFAAILLEDQIENKPPRVFVRDVLVNYGKESLAYAVQGISPQFQFIENVFMSQGRFINMQDEYRIYIPVNKTQQVFNGADYVNNLSYTLPPAENFEAAVAQSIKFKNPLKTYLQQAHTVAPDDTSAIKEYNPMEEAKRFYSLMGGIKYFFWFVGVCTIIVGINQGDKIKVWNEVKPDELATN